MLQRRRHALSASTGLYRFTRASLCLLFVPACAEDEPVSNVPSAAMHIAILTFDGSSSARWGMWSLLAQTMTNVSVCVVHVFAARRAAIANQSPGAAWFVRVRSTRRMLLRPPRLDS